MNILVTGADGFIGKNLIAHLKNLGYKNIHCYDRNSSEECLKEYCKDCDFVFHLAGVNRPEVIGEFMDGNSHFTEYLVKLLAEAENRCPILYTSSIQASQDNPYGASKKAGEEVLTSYGLEQGVKVYIYRLPNVFGKWCRPHYNSVIATFCFQIARAMPVDIRDPEYRMTLVYIDDVVEEMIRALEGRAAITADGYCSVAVTHDATLQELAELIQSFHECRTNLYLPNVTEGSLSKKLYSTYLSYLPEDGFSYPLNMQGDERGAFTEVFKTFERGQCSVNIIKPGITKGEHWHHSKNEKFLVVHGEGMIRFRKIDSEEILEYAVSGKQLQVVDIPCGYTHNISNLGSDDMTVLMWCNECFDKTKPDTYYLKVEETFKND